MHARSALFVGVQVLRLELPGARDVPREGAVHVHRVAVARLRDEVPEGFGVVVLRAEELGQGRGRKGVESERGAKADSSAVCGCWAENRVARARAWRAAQHIDSC